MTNSRPAAAGGDTGVVKEAAEKRFPAVILSMDSRFRLSMLRMTAPTSFSAACVAPTPHVRAPRDPNVPPRFPTRE